MTTITTRVRAGLATTVLAGTAVLVAAPAYAAVAPEEPSSALQVSQPNKAQIEHEENLAKGGQPSQSVIDHYSVTVEDTTPQLGAQTKAQIEQLERAAREQENSTSGTSGGTSSDDDTNVPVAWLVLASGAAVAGAAGFTVYRIRHNGPMSPATA